MIQYVVRGLENKMKKLFLVSIILILLISIGLYNYHLKATNNNSNNRTSKQKIHPTIEWIDAVQEYYERGLDRPRYNTGVRKECAELKNIVLSGRQPTENEIYQVLQYKDSANKKYELEYAIKIGQDWFEFSIEKMQEKDSNNQ